MNTTYIKFNLGNMKYYMSGFSIAGSGKNVNEDYYSFYHDHSSIIAVVADGLGSAIKSSYGAKFICEVAIAELSKDSLSDTLFEEIYNGWKEKITGNILAYDTTMRFLKISRGEIVIGGIGDGWTSILNGNVFFTFESNQVFTNQTESMMSNDKKNGFQMKRIKLAGEFLVSIATDGYSEDIDKKQTLKYLKQIDSGISDSDNFIKNMEDMMTQWPIETNCDDKTVIFIKGVLINE